MIFQKSKHMHGCAKVPVKCIENGKVYESQSAAAKDVKIPASYVSASMRRNATICGFTFQRVEVANENTGITLTLESKEILK